MTDKKRNKFRGNMKGFVDADYKCKLSAEELRWYEQFENEYYSNALGKEGSLHRTNLSPEDFEIAKKETYGATNAQNRDLYGISATSNNYLMFIDDEENYIEPEGVYDSVINKMQDPNYNFKTFLTQTLDEIQSDTGRDLETVLIEYGKEMVKLGNSLRPDKVNTALKRAKQKTESENEEGK